MTDEKSTKKQLIAESTRSGSSTFVKGHANTATACALSHGDRWVASAGKDGAVYQCKAKPVRAVTFCGDSFGGNILVSGGEDKLVRLWDMRKPGDCVKEMAGHQGAVNGIRFAFDQSTNAGKLYTVGADKAVKSWYIDGTQGKVFNSYFGHTGSVLCMDMMSLDRPITGGDDHAVRAWALNRDSHSLFSSSGHTAAIDSVFMLDPSHYVSGGQDGSICLWGATSRKSLAKEEEAHGGSWVTSVSGVRNSDLALSGSSDGHIRAWRVGRPGEGESSKKTKMVLDEQLDWSIPVSGIVNEIAVSEKGQLVVAAVGRDHKHGRWITASSAYNGLLFAQLRKID